MSNIKYRQYFKPHLHTQNGSKFHYYGWIDEDGFVGPVGKNHSGSKGDQFTGLKDKNGVEIYEGDIVTDEYGNLSVDYSKIGAVSMGFTFDSDGYNCGSTYGWVSSNGSSLSDLEDCEIIGNIHENPDLLGGDND